MSLIRRSWRLALFCLLVAMQASVLAIGLFRPSVSPGYRAYFIDHTMAHRTDWWPGPDIVPETALQPTSTTVNQTDPPPRG
jgi:hypothetical protein